MYSFKFDVNPKVRGIVNLTDVIEALVEERGLPREDIIAAVCEGVKAAYGKRFPGLDLEVVYNKRQGRPEIFAKKTVVANVDDEDFEISLRKARVLNPSVQLDEEIDVPLEITIGRIEVLAAKQIITGKIRELEQKSIAKEFKSKESTIISGIAHKRERAGIVVKIGEIMALLPNANSIPAEVIRIGVPVRCLLKEVLEVPRSGFQLILDRASSLFVERLLALEIPEVYEGIVEIKKIVRIAGYKTKAIVTSNNKDIDPVGTCVGVDGVRVKPIIRELNGEKIDLIEWTESLELLVKYSLKPAEIDKVEIIEGHSAMVWLSSDQRSLAIGKMGRNIALAAELTGINIKLQDLSPGESSVSPFEHSES